MRSESEIANKLSELNSALSKLERHRRNMLPWAISQKELLEIQFLKNNIAFIEWALNKPESEPANIQIK